MGLPRLTELALIVFFGRTNGFITVRTELALTSLLGATLLSQMGLPGQMELKLTTLKMDIRKNIFACLFSIHNIMNKHV